MSSGSEHLMRPMRLNRAGRRIDASFARRSKRRGSNFTKAKKR